MLPIRHLLNEVPQTGKGPSSCRYPISPHLKIWLLSLSGNPSGWRGPSPSPFSLVTISRHGEMSWLWVVLSTTVVPTRRGPRCSTYDWHSGPKRVWKEEQETPRPIVGTVRLGVCDGFSRGTFGSDVSPSTLEKVRRKEETRDRCITHDSVPHLSFVYLSYKVKGRWGNLLCKVINI